MRSGPSAEVVARVLRDFRVAGIVATSSDSVRTPMRRQLAQRIRGPLTFGYLAPFLTLHRAAQGAARWLGQAWNTG